MIYFSIIIPPNWAVSKKTLLGSGCKIFEMQFFPVKYVMKKFSPWKKASTFSFWPEICCCNYLLKGERKHGLQSIVTGEFFLVLILPLEKWDLHGDPQEFYHTVEGCGLRFNRDSAIAALK